MNDSIKIGIIIISLNRFDFLSRVINYYKSLNKKNYSIYIGDSTNQNQYENLKKNNQNYKFNYFHTPGLNDRETILYLSKKVKENYIAFSGDDDFMNCDSLVKCAKFLEQNKDYRTAQGRAYTFAISNNDYYGKINFFYKYWDKKSNEYDTAKKRLLNFCDNYYVTQFSVHRTDEYIEDSIDHAKSKDRGMSEYIHCFSSIGRGKSKYIDCLHMFRQVGHKYRGQSQHSGLIYKNINIWENKKDYSVIVFTNLLKKILFKIDRLSSRDSEKNINLIIKKMYKIHKIKTNIKSIKFVKIIILFKRIFKFIKHLFIMKRNSYNSIIDEKDFLIVENFKRFISKT